MSKVSRRNVLSIGAATMAAATLGPVAQAADQNTSKDKPYFSVPEKWDYTTEVLVVGSGGAGLASAVSAAENGAKVTVVEKLPFIGGNTRISSGYFNCVDPERQKPQGIEDSVEKHIQQTLAGGDYRANPELVKLLCTNALDTLHWLESKGLKFHPEVIQVYGALWPRSHLSTEPNGSGYIRVLKQDCDKLGVKFLMEKKLCRIIREDGVKGRVLGIETIDEDGKPFFIRATKGVILAAGGFAANPKLRALHDPRLLTVGTTNNRACSTGEVMLAANEAGAYLVGLDYFQCCPGPAGEKNKDMEIYNDVTRCIFVNKEGKRFVSEDERRDVIRDAILDQTDKVCYAIVDIDGFDLIEETERKRIKSGLKTGDAFTADTVEGLAEAIGLPVETLKKTVETYNHSVDTKKDPECGKQEHNLLFKLEKGPYWAGLLGAAAHHTMGGVRVDENHRVIDRDGCVIPGLYAAGEVTGGVHGSNRLGGNAIAEIFTFGRRAGKSAAQQV